MKRKQIRSLAAPKRRDWFGNSLFNLLVDYYPEVSFRPYGAGAAPGNVLPVLEKLRPGCLIVYAKGHGGYTTFPSSLRTQHPSWAGTCPKHSASTPGRPA